MKAIRTIYDEVNSPQHTFKNAMSFSIKELVEYLEENQENAVIIFLEEFSYYIIRSVSEQLDSFFFDIMPAGDPNDAILAGTADEAITAVLRYNANYTHELALPMRRDDGFFYRKDKPWNEA